MGLSRVWACLGAGLWGQGYYNFRRRCVCGVCGWVLLWARYAGGGVSGTPSFLGALLVSSLPGPVVRLRKSKSCQNHLELHTWLPNHVLLTVRTEKSLKNQFNQLRQGGPKMTILQCKNSQKSMKYKNELKKYFPIFEI